MSNYTQYLNFIEEQANLVNNNTLLENALNASRKLLDSIEQNKERINADIKKEILKEINVYEKKEKNILSIIQKVETLVKGDNLKKYKLNQSINSLQSIINKRKGAFFPSSSIQDKYIEKYYNLLKKTDNALTENEVTSLDSKINSLKKEIINDLEFRDKKNYKILKYIIGIVLGLIFVIAFWGIVKWLLLIAAIIGVIALFSD